MKSEELRRLVDEEIPAARENLQLWLAKRDEDDIQIRKARKYLERLEALRAMWDEVKAEGGAVPLSPDEAKDHNAYKDLSIADAAYEVLKKAGMPLHAKKILAAIHGGGKVLASKTPLLSVTSALFRDDRFENIGGNTFRLKPPATGVNELS